MKIHRLKTVSRYFHEVKCGLKTFECRLNDRNFQVGDELILEEYTAILNPEGCGYTGNICHRRISYILSDFVGLQPGYVILGLEQPI
jgi:hypothetical protein